MSSILRAGILGLLFLAASLVSPASAQQQIFPRSTLTIETQSGQRFPFAVELALTPAQQAQGLMFRESMADNAGMLFVNPTERPVSFWMMNTLIPLDMVFIDRTGRIVRIHENAVPHDTTPIPSGQPVLAILEINGGLSRRLGIRPGDRVIHDAFRGG
ncbi:MAG TPA: DUF192 domain-containing protein [Azospirillaceae bacterium]|nr:DUF192 domain-containing protein [Azospirillaceae bacterium]